MIQDTHTASPSIPALTPVGFAHWMTLYILAYPEEESRRLEQVVLAEPIDADGKDVDGRPERLPKQISRHLLPKKEDKESRKHLENAIDDFLEDLDKPSQKAKISSPTMSRHSSSQSYTSSIRSATTPKAKPIERERMPYAGAPSADAAEEAVKIERERQPYSAQPGTGKVYGDKSSTESANLNIPPKTRPSRSNSTAVPSSRGRDTSEGTERRQTRTHSNSMHGQMGAPPRTTGGRRPSSPPLKNYSNSASGVLDSQYGPSSSSSRNQTETNSSAYGSAAFPPPPPLDSHSSREKRYRDERPYHRSTDDEDRLTGEFISPRDTERWDRYQETRASGDDGYADHSYDRRASMHIDPRGEREKPAEDWHRYQRGY